MQTMEQHRQSKPGPFCIWMQAGVVRNKNCSREFQCPGCRFDRMLLRVAAENRRAREMGSIPPGKGGQIVHWREKLRLQPISQRPCVHAMKGRIAFRPCTHDYICGDCEFDQYFEDQFSVHAVVRPVDLLQIEGFKVPQGFYLHGGHTWVKIEEGNSVRVGLDDFALRLLGPLDRIETPLLGQKLLQGRGDITGWRKGRKARFQSPVDGVVTAVNPRPQEDGRCANDDPYAAGWAVQVQAENLREGLKALLMGDETESYYTGEVDRLYREIEMVAGPLAADGGYLGHDIYGSLPDLGWDRLTRIFLRI